jgi:hypothetical protein
MSVTYKTEAEGSERSCRTVSLDFCIHCRKIKILVCILLLCEISGPHGGEYEDDSLLGYSAVQSC